SITAKVVTGSVTAADKGYDGTTTATVTSCTLTGVMGSDAVTCVPGAGTFDTPTVGTGKLVTVTGLTLSGANAANYTLANPTATTSATIAVATVTATVAVANKVYDASPNAVLSACALSGLVGSDVVSCIGGVPRFASAGIGTSKTVTVTGLALGGVNAGNYTLLSTTATTTADITAATITATVAAPSKAYHGPTTPPITAPSSTAPIPPH